MRKIVFAFLLVALTAHTQQSVLPQKRLERDKKNRNQISAS